jgi:exosortase
MTYRRLGKGDLAGWLVLAILVGWFYHGTLAGLFARWWDDPTYSHGLIVPFVSLYFLYEGLRENRAMKAEGSLWGAALLVAALGLFFVGRLGNMLFLQAVAFIGTVAALALLVEGRTFLRVAALPIAFLIFMCPLPSGIYDAVSGQLRLFASATSTVLLQLVGVPAASSGNIIYIPNAQLSVEDACSGIRSLFGILATATTFAFVMRGGFVRKAFLIVSAAPIAVFTNIMRVTGTGILQNSGHSGLAEGFYHQIEGWGFYVIALALLVGEYVVLKVVFPIDDGRPKQGAGGAGGGEATR